LSLNLPKLNVFYFDRVWLKAYPSFFSNLKVKEFMDIYRTYRDEGIFTSMTENAFRLYRTLDCIRRGLSKGLDPNDLNAGMCSEVRKYGEHDYYMFEFNGKEFVIDVGEGKFNFTLDQVNSVRFISYTTVVRDKLHYEKSIYLEYGKWLRVMVKPYLEGFMPPMVRVFYNPLLRTKEFLGINTSKYEFQYDNFVDPYVIDVEEFADLNHKLAFDVSFLKEFVDYEWFKWFGRREDLTIKITQVELSFDTMIPKIDLVSAFHFIGGKSKTIKYSVDGVDYSWTDSGLKYYITVKKGFQVKTYTKAWNSEKVLNRLEFTLSVNQPIELVDHNSVLGNSELREVYMTLSKGLVSGDVIERIKEIIKPLIRCRERCEDHYAFWLDLLTSGEIKGTRYYKSIAEVYKELGYIKVKGRGRNSAYVINENFLPFISRLKKDIERYLGISFSELKLPKHQPNQQRDNSQQL